MLARNQGGGARRYVADGVAVVGANFDQTLGDMHAVAHGVDSDRKCRPLHHGGKQRRLHAEVRLPLPIDLEKGRTKVLQNPCHAADFGRQCGATVRPYHDPLLTVRDHRAAVSACRDAGSGR
ncbi:hypothetical protein A4249_14325 [Brevundimonas sp. GW460-12-10-14-LB2]|nr:hypothetical protein A4249_14325 [Brevundimonas sp. GW460-12-10-14-LB2]